MLRWPTRAKVAIRKLFEPLQDIDVYVEDTNDEAFYRTLLNRIANGNVKISRVFSLGGRMAVINAAKEHDHSQRRALFIVDGDLEWVYGENSPPIIGLHQHNAYCIENFLICEKSISQILAQEIILAEDDAFNIFNFKDWIDAIQEPLTKLFSAFATSKKYAPENKTVSLGVGVIVTCNQKVVELDEGKVNKISNEALAAAKANVGEITAQKTYKSILDKINKLTNPLHAVSGKDFLLPLLDFRLQQFGCRIRRKSLRMRLATSGDIDRFVALDNAIKNAALGAS